MNRERYETPDDLKREHSAKDFLNETTDLVYRKVPESYHFDWCVFGSDKKMVGVAEYKYRGGDKNFNSYATVMLSLLKFEVLWRYMGMGFTAKFFVESNEGIHFWHLHQESINMPISWGGRTTKTRDEADIEPVVYFDKSEWTRLKGSSITARQF